VIVVRSSRSFFPYLLTKISHVISRRLDATNNWLVNNSIVPIITTNSSLAADVSTGPKMKSFPWVSENAKNVLNPAVNLNGI
jgi:hypothetical protein